MNRVAKIKQKAEPLSQWSPPIFRRNPGQENTAPRNRGLSQTRWLLSLWEKGFFGNRITYTIILEKPWFRLTKHTQDTGDSLQSMRTFPAISYNLSFFPGLLVHDWLAGSLRPCEMYNLLSVFPLTQRSKLDLLRKFIGSRPVTLAVK